MHSLRPHPSPLLARLLFGTNAARTVVVGARHASTEAAVATPEQSVSVPVPVPALTTEPTDGEPKQGGRRSRGIPPPGHGERLWVYNHIVDNFTIYSMTPALRSNKAFRQMPHTGKKLIPAKLRKDYWRPMAVVEFGAGRGDVGRSVFHKLRELQRRHQLEWDDPDLLAMSRRERGKALNDQRGNSVADLAAVLAGRGKGNRVVFLGEAENESSKVGGGKSAKGGVKKNKKTDPVETAKGAAAGEEKEEEGGVVEMGLEQSSPGAEAAGKKVKLYPATVYWANEQDKYYAESWTENVAHVVGLPMGRKKGGKAVEAAAGPVGEAEAAVETPKPETTEAAKAE
ncbi:hypothetical protein N658DRAFT_490741 [Parathielavia hyrcaniae]|uniref:Large ribosomal subunit protein mL67 n=1 Tax=Parathielavia hyrcaniae TaxID=113614 RepID=A0AAN6T630_9PEZI|nr:hypothetical protein N658DRAFT_490741 [Parathielavia hyrcaniae]